MKKHFYKEYIIKNNYKVINCTICGYWHVWPLPSQKQLGLYYKNKYYKTLKNNPTMIDKIDDPDGFYFLQYEDRLRQIMKVFPPDLPKTIIDIGAGYGDFLVYMKNKGWLTQGVEPSKIAHSYIKDKNLNIMCCGIDKLDNLRFEPAALVTIYNVLEHLINPDKLLDTVKKYLLLPKGILSIIVPNDFNPFQLLMMKTVLKNRPEKQYYWVCPPDHLNYWSIKTMKLFMKNNGFKILSRTVDFPIDIFPLLGDNYIIYPQKGRKTHLKRVSFEKNYIKLIF